ncbi:MAG: 2,5-didehydrogluconate reductase DkgB [Paludibacterium sp.]|uniref:2,5-didehydrogluconate reductase DkgB n=1 Tax=Paludibacterium sp. TaxID=1917523 RepID=UPI0025D39057|nr:2,5-didehydrogluconate reductase DkgB [Paludibacterium sp.]MBV8046193.1 2,5-didehydrogluconate reductase DkgB [Paludibacterium sp.]
MTLPAFGLGTFRLQGQQVIDAVRHGLDLGYRHIDTAQIYGNEAEVGQAIADSAIARDALFLTTKIWLDNLSADKLIISLKDSLRKLRTDQVDLTLIHWPAPANGPAVADYLPLLLEAKKQGLTRQIGVSNFTIRHLREAIAVAGREEIATNQVELHPFLQNRALAGFMREQGIKLTAYMPLAYGKVMQDATLQAIAARYQANPAQIALAWLLQQGHLVIPSSTKRDHLLANLAAPSLHLDEADMTAIAGLDRGERLASPDFAPSWD